MNQVAQTNRYLSFCLGAEKFALPLLKVREVIAPPTTTPIPQAPAFCLGYMNLRGEVITVLDLRKKFSIRAENGPELSVVICEIGKVSVGLMVDQINQVLSPKPEEITNKPEGAGGKFADCIRGVYRDSQGLVLLVDIDAALADVAFSEFAAAPAA